jgi:hypothetical protein
LGKIYFKSKSEKREKEENYTMKKSQFFKRI